MEVTLYREEGSGWTLMVKSVGWWMDDLLLAVWVKLQYWFDQLLITLLKLHCRNW